MTERIVLPSIEKLRCCALFKALDFFSERNFLILSEFFRFVCVDTLVEELCSYLGRPWVGTRAPSEVGNKKWQVLFDGITWRAVAVRVQPMPFTPPDTNNPEAAGKTLRTNFEFGHSCSRD